MVRSVVPHGTKITPNDTYLNSDWWVVLVGFVPRPPPGRDPRRSFFWSGYHALFSCFSLPEVCLRVCSHTQSCLPLSDSNWNLVGVVGAGQPQARWRGGRDRYRLASLLWDRGNTLQTRLLLAEYRRRRHLSVTREGRGGIYSKQFFLLLLFSFILSMPADGEKQSSPHNFHVFLHIHERVCVHWTQKLYPPVSSASWRVCPPVPTLFSLKR